MKRLLSVALMLCMVISISSVTASADIVDSGTCGENLTWELDSEGTLTISGTGPMYDPVEEVSMNMPWKGKVITKVIIEEGVTSIATAAFFNYNHDYDDLTEVVIPNTVTHIGSNAFTLCHIKSIDIPDSVKTIGRAAFGNCSDLEEVTIGANVESIGEYAFSGSEALKSITVDENNEQFVSVGGVLFDKAQTQLICYPAKKTGERYTIPESVNTLGGGVFMYNDSLKQVVMHGGISAIPDSAFYGCIALEEMTIPESVESIGQEAFSLCKSLKSIVLPDSVTIVSQKTFDNCHSLEYIDFGNSVTAIYFDSFQYCPKLSTMVVPKTLTFIESAFSLTKNIKDIYYNGSVEDWAAIEIDDDELLNPTIHYNCVFNETIDNADFVTTGDAILAEVDLGEDNGAKRLVVGGNELYYSVQRDKYIGFVNSNNIVDEKLTDVVIAPSVPTSFVYGNVDGDNEYEDITDAVDSADLWTMKLVIKGDEVFTGVEVIASDLDGDGLCDSSDLQELKMKIKDNSEFSILK